MTRTGCETVVELLAAFADGGLEGGERERLNLHLAGCAACRDEVTALREALAAVKREAAAETAGLAATGRAAAPGDDGFWRDFTRDTRVAYERAAEAGRRAGLLGWLRGAWWRPVTVVAAVAAAAVLIFVMRGERSGGERAAAPKAPDAGVGAGVAVGSGTQIVEELGPEGVEDMDEEQLDRVLSVLEPIDDDDDDELSDDEADTAETAEPYEAIEELDDEEIARVLDALTKGV